MELKLSEKILINNFGVCPAQEKKIPLLSYNQVVQLIDNLLETNSKEVIDNCPYSEPEQKEAWFQGVIWRATQLQNKQFKIKLLK